MIRWHSAGRSVLFAAAAALGWLPFALISGSWLGGRPALAWYLAAVVAAYLAGLPESPPAQLRAGLLGAVAALAVVVFAPDLPVGIFALAVLLAVGRSACIMGGRRGRGRGSRLLAPLPLGRAIAIEVGLGAVGLGAATLLWRGPHGPLLGVALGIWSYFLIQSSFFWIGGGTSVPPARHEDAFEAARRRALGIIGRAP